MSEPYWTCEGRYDVAEVEQRLESLKLEERNNSPTEQEMEGEFKKSFMGMNDEVTFVFKSVTLSTYVGEMNEQERSEFVEWFPFLREEVKPLDL